MEQEENDNTLPITPGRGSEASALWFRAKLMELGWTQSRLARFMIAYGDDRSFDTILRATRRMASGEARVSGEMRAMLGMMDLLRQRAPDTLQIEPRQPAV